MIWFSCFVVCLCIFVIWFFRCCWFSFVLQEQHVFPSIPTYHFLRTKKFEGSISTDWIPRVQNLSSSKCKKHCKQFVELARCERVITTRAEFHFSWVYALYHAQILADLRNPSTERDRLRPSTPCAIVLII